MFLETAPRDAQLIDAVARAREQFAAYTADLLAAYEARRLARIHAGTPVVNFVGHGRCGKDTSASFYAAATGVSYGGSTSQIVNPMIAWCLGLSPEQSFEQRHEHRKYWFDWCHEFRKDDPAILTKMLLGQGDLCTGTRARRELLAGLDEPHCVDVVVWVHNVRTGVDPTLEYDAGDILKLPSPRWAWIDNNQDKAALQTQVERLVDRVYQ